MQIKVNAGLDSICLPNCSMMREACDFLEEADFYCLGEYGLEYLYDYDSKTILERIRGYPASNGYKWESPKSKFLDLRN